MMNFNIEKFGKFLTVALILVSISPIYYLGQLYEKSHLLVDIEEDRHKMQMVSSELRQSSNDLTKHARLYVATGDVSYRDNYYEILFIRDGKSKRPYKYENIYWDLQEPLRSQRHPRKEKENLINCLHNLPFKDDQFRFLEMSKNNSDDLVNMEKQAFKLMEANMQSEAIALLFSKKYLKAKEKIMLPIDKFLLSLEKSTSTKIKSCNNTVDGIYNKIFLTIAFGIAFFILIIYVLRKKLLIPIASLTESITAYELGKELNKPTIFYDDELGLMTKKFYYMKERLDERFEAITQLSLTDPLTQIKNRRAFFELGDDYLRLASRYSHSLSLFIIDIDFFKNVNDTYGHLVGDEILKHLVNTVGVSLRQTDLFARFGGEEFIVLLPETNLNNAMGVAENIRLLVENTPYENDELHIPIAISIGVNEFTDEKNISELIDSADKALYRAKKNGRNRVES